MGIMVAVLASGLAACHSASPETALPVLTFRPTPGATEDEMKPTLSSTDSPQTGDAAIDLMALLAMQRQVAFASDRTGAGDIYVATLGGELTNLTHHPAADWDPAWSPACGQSGGECRIAFTSHRSGDSEIWTMNSEGRDLRNITQDPAWDYWPAWSPDGEWLAFVSERDGDPELFIAPSDGTQGQEAIQLTFNDDSDRLPAWSPDGSRIAFAAVRNGVEEIHVINAYCTNQAQGCGSHERPVTAWPLKGTSPAWSPDGRRIAFIGWNEDDSPGIYVVGPEPESIQKLWEGNAWIGSLSWTPDTTAGEKEGWLFFTSWQDGNHEIYALPASGGTPIRLTYNRAWDDFPSARPGLGVAPQPIELQESSSASTSPQNTNFGYGVNIADLGNAYLVRDMGFTWAKSYVNWETVEPEPGQYRWIDPDNIVSALDGYDVHILMRVHGTPAWARPEGTFLSHPPNDADDFARFMRALAARYKGRVGAYEIWNEPNLNYEWGYLEPDPAGYTTLLKAAYQAVKEVDPEALVISGGLATTGEGSPTAMGDLTFLQGMYTAGAQGYFDALGSHPYAFGHDPDYQDPWGLSLSRVVQQRDVMLTNGDTKTPVWITETGWVLNTNWNLVEHEAIAVDEAQQADYLVRAYQKIPQEWPWVGATFLFNLDFSGVPWYPAAEPMRWYAILNPDRTPRPAYTNVKSQMMNVK
jgi:WD40 repeat protein